VKLENKESNSFRFFKQRSKKLISIKVRLPRILSGLLWKERLLRKAGWEFLKSKLYYENLLRFRCKKIGNNFVLFGEMPYITGSGNIIIGDNVEMHNKITLFTGGAIYDEPELHIGDNTVIGSGVLIRMHKQILIGNNCLIASNVIIGDNDGHPLHVDRRAKFLKIKQKDAKSVIIEDDVWIGENSTILKGVTIGRGSIVSAGSVVMKSIPPMKIVMGNPARVVMWVPEND